MKTIPFYKKDRDKEKSPEFLPLNPAPILAIKRIYPNVKIAQQEINYIAFWNYDNMIKSHEKAEPCPELLEFCYDFSRSTWIQFKSSGTIGNPIETFIRII